MSDQVFYVIDDLEGSLVVRTEDGDLIDSDEPKGYQDARAIVDGWLSAGLQLLCPEGVDALLLQMADAYEWPDAPAEAAAIFQVGFGEMLPGDWALVEAVNGEAALRIFLSERGFDPACKLSQIYTGRLDNGLRVARAVVRLRGRRVNMDELVAFERPVLRGRS